MRAIILGDLNTWEPAAVKKTSQLFLSENFTTPFANGKSTFLRTVLLIPIRLKLDWIWLRGLEATSHGIDKKIGLSDHLAVVDRGPLESLGGNKMRCPNCARPVAWTRTRCRACRTKLIQWYIMALALGILGCVSAFLILEAVL